MPPMLLLAIVLVVAIVAAVVALQQRPAPPSALSQAAASAGLPHSFRRRQGAVDLMVTPVCSVCGTSETGRSALPPEFDLRVLDPVAARALFLHAALPKWRLVGTEPRCPKC
jgi:hypothetical protein